MNIRVQYHGQLRTEVGQAEVEIELRDSATMADLLSVLASRLEKSAVSHLVNASGEAQSGLLVVVNEKAIPRQDMARTVLRPSDVVALLPPIAGG